MKSFIAGSILLTAGATTVIAAFFCHDIKVKSLMWNITAMLLWGRLVMELLESAKRDL